MTKYLRAILRAGVGSPCWPGENLQYRIYQSPPELAALCEWVEERRVTSYLEIGLGAGGTWRLLTALFDFAPSCGITLDGPRVRETPPGAHLFVGNSGGVEALAFACEYGPFDFVFIDGDHHHGAVLGDWQIYGPLGKYVGLHDIAGLYDCEGSRTSWQVICEEAEVLAEFIDPDWPVGIGIVRGGA